MKSNLNEVLKGAKVGQVIDYSDATINPHAGVYIKVNDSTLRWQSTAGSMFIEADSLAQAYPTRHWNTRDLFFVLEDLSGNVVSKDPSVTKVEDIPQPKKKVRVVRVPRKERRKAERERAKMLEKRSAASNSPIEPGHLLMLPNK